jgi:hypothetical protein
MATAETAFTPGPWVAHPLFNAENRFVIMREEVKGVTRRKLRIDCGGYGQFEAADARLIATAPKLYVALLTLRGVIEAAGIHNLSNGVPFGQTSWAVKCTDAMALANDALLEACPAETLAESRA